MYSSTRHSETPFVLLMGLMSTMDSFNGMLNKRCLSLISKHFFPSSSPSELLNSFLINLMTSGFPIQLSSRLYSCIVNDMFMCLDYSISNLIYRFEVSVELICINRSIDSSTACMNMSITALIWRTYGPLVNLLKKT